MQNDTSEPKVLIIRLLEACNAGCFMCSFQFSKDEFRFSVEEAKHIINNIKKSKIQLVRFTGGEPLIHEQIFDIIQLFSNNNIKTSLITNGGKLPQSFEALQRAGLSQVIVSLDAADEKHDRFRQYPGLFQSICQGLSLLRDNNSSIRTRVNTVAGPHNYKDLPRLYDLLSELKVSDWSIIPLKTEKGAWGYNKSNEIREAHKSFVDHVTRHTGPRLLGYSLNWIGKDETEINNYLEGLKNIAPSGKCNLVTQVRYYVPKTREYYTCNCVSHRENGASLSQPWGDDALTAAGLGEHGRWLYDNGHHECKGCEPVNAALAENKIDLIEDPFGY